MPLNSAWWSFVENYIYYSPEPPPRTRTKPLQVICVGPPRSATESLQAGLQRLGYDAVYHGWDILFEEPNRSRGWVRLARRKWLNEAPGLPIRAEEFDELMGHAEAVVDAAGSVFAAELIAAYPEAKVILNTRKDMDAWMRSMDESLISINKNWILYSMHWFYKRLFWSWNAYERYLWPAMFRNLDSREGHAAATAARGKWVYQEHCNMIRGLVPRERLLEWTVQEGWEPLCKFLDRDVPDEPFPHVNTKDKGWKDREAQLMGGIVVPAMRNAAMLTAVVLGGLAAAGVAYYRGQ